MTLLALMYHRARPGPHGNAPAMLDAHFARIASSYRCVLPGDPLDPSRLNVCLTFDDGYFDFHSVVVPLLARHGLRALLAVPPGLVPERTSASPRARLEAPALSEDGREANEGLCTWPELREVASSGLVAIAAHGFTHRRVDPPEADLEREVVLPGAMLAERLGRPVDSFVFPYGRFSPRALAKVRKHYRFAFRIGGADNPGWEGPLLYRVGADGLPSPDAPFAARRRAGYRARRCWSRLRGR